MATVGDHEPYIVPPTHNKLSYHLEIRNVWHQAAAAISEASAVIVIGYSLPANDQFVRSFLGLSTISKNRFPEFVVIDPSSQVEESYKSLLSTSARKRFKFHQLRFEDPAAISMIEDCVQSLH
jgi:hypothetical protein